MKMLQGLNGKILKTRDGKAVKITSIGEFQSALPVPAKAPMDEPAKLQDFVSFTTESILSAPPSPNKYYF